jgi:hypothetical protein
LRQYLKTLLLNLIPAERREMTARLFMNSLGFGQTSLEVEVKSFSFYANKSRLQNFTVLDVGASVGHYTRSLLLHTKAQIVCFETSP